MSELLMNKQKATVILDKDIVASNIEELKTDLKQTLSDGAVEITIDMKKVEMIDSMGIGVLIATHNSLKKLDSHLILINVSANIDTLLKTMRLHEHFTIQ